LLNHQCVPNRLSNKFENYVIEKNRIDVEVNFIRMLKVLCRERTNTYLIIAYVKNKNSF